MIKEKKKENLKRECKQKMIFYPYETAKNKPNMLSVIRLGVVMRPIVAPNISFYITHNLLVFSYIKSYNEIQLDEAPNFDYLGHPINSYQGPMLNSFLFSL
jgi:hypothetical protein